MFRPESEMFALSADDVRSVLGDGMMNVLMYREWNRVYKGILPAQPDVRYDEELVNDVVAYRSANRDGKIAMLRQGYRNSGLSA